jgi:hypothetical protein
MRSLALVFLAACTHTALYAQPSTLANHAAELAGDGRASVEVDQGGTAQVRADDLVEITLPGHQRSYLWGLVTVGQPGETRELTVRNLVAGCGQGGDCLAERATGPVHVGTRRGVDPYKLAIGIFGALATVGASACLATCRDPGGWAWVGTGIATATMIAPLSTVF